MPFRNRTHASNSSTHEFYPVILNTVAKVKTFRVYNRYGQLIHDSETPWNGKFKNADQPAGTYVYYIVVQRPYKDDEKPRAEGRSRS